jgi:hypothetical protein
MFDFSLKFLQKNAKLLSNILKRDSFCEIFFDDMRFLHIFAKMSVSAKIFAKLFGFSDNFSENIYFHESFRKNMSKT